MKTYGNPLPLPDYPLGRFNHNKEENGMDPAGIDEHGNLFVAGSTDTPQFAPGLTAITVFGECAPIQ